MVDAPAFATVDQTHSTPYLLGRIESKLDTVAEALRSVREQQAATDARLSHLEERLGNVEASVRSLNEKEEARSAAGRQHSLRSVSRRDALVVGGALAVWSVLLNALEHAGALPWGR